MPPKSEKPAGASPLIQNDPSGSKLAVLVDWLCDTKGVHKMRMNNSKLVVHFFIISDLPVEKVSLTWSDLLGHQLLPLDLHKNELPRVQEQYRQYSLFLLREHPV